MMCARRVVVVICYVWLLLITTVTITTRTTTTTATTITCIIYIMRAQYIVNSSIIGVTHTSHMTRVVQVSSSRRN